MELFVFYFAARAQDFVSECVRLISFSMTLFVSGFSYGLESTMGSQCIRMMDKIHLARALIL